MPSKESLHSLLDEDASLRSSKFSCSLLKVWIFRSFNSCGAVLFCLLRGDTCRTTVKNAAPNQNDGLT